MNRSAGKLPFALLRADHATNKLPGLCEYVIVHTFLPPSPVILWILLDGKPKWLLLKFGYHDVMRTSPIIKTNRAFLYFMAECGYTFRHAHWN